jgi:hypothetical protein
MGGSWRTQSATCNDDVFQNIPCRSVSTSSCPRRASLMLQPACPSRMYQFANIRLSQEYVTVCYSLPLLYQSYLSRCYSLPVPVVSTTLLQPASTVPIISVTLLLCACLSHKRFIVNLVCLSVYSQVTVCRKIVICELHLVLSSCNSKWTHLHLISFQMYLNWSKTHLWGSCSTIRFQQRTTTRQVSFKLFITTRN